MTDISKRIDVNGSTLFQIGYESLVPNDGKVYGLQKGTTGKMAAKLVEIADAPDASELMTGTAVEIADLASDADAATIVTTVNALLEALRDRGVLATPADNGEE